MTIDEIICHMERKRDSSLETIKEVNRNNGDGFRPITKSYHQGKYSAYRDIVDFLRSHRGVIKD